MKECEETVIEVVKSFQEDVTKDYLFDYD